MVGGTGSGEGSVKCNILQRVCVTLFASLHPLYMQVQYLLLDRSNAELVRTGERMPTKTSKLFFLNFRKLTYTKIT